MPRSLLSKLTKLEETDLAQSGKEIEIQKPAQRQKKDKPLVEPIKDWFPQISEGKLSLDVYVEGNNIIVVSAIAGVSPEDLEIIVDKDILTIKGKRKYQESIEQKNYLHRECFWGSFSRTVILPFEVRNDGIKAGLKNGILTISLPKKEIKPEEKIKIRTRSREK